MSWLKKIEPASPRGWFGASAVMLALSLILSGLNAAGVLAAPLRATIPTKVGFEGYLTDPANSANPLPTGSYSILFSLYSVASGGTATWSETQTVSVQNGYFSVQLGSVSALSAGTFGGNQWIGVKVGTNAEVSPRTPLSAVPFALNAETANSATSATTATNATNANAVPWGGITGMPAGFADGVDANSGGTVTGSGASGALALWNGASSQSYDAGLTASGSSLIVNGGLNVGTTGAAAGSLKLSGSINASTPIAARVERTASYAVASGTAVVIPFDAERAGEDPLGMHSTTTNPSRITVPASGIYLLSCGVRFDPNTAASLRSVNVYVNGMEVGAGNINALANQAVHVDTTTAAFMSAGQYAECSAYQNSGASANITLAAYRSIEFVVARLP